MRSNSNILCIKRRNADKAKRNEKCERNVKGKAESRRHGENQATGLKAFNMAESKRAGGKRAERLRRAKKTSEKDIGKERNLA